MRPAIEHVMRDGLTRHRDDPLVIWLFGPDDRPLAKQVLVRIPSGMAIYDVVAATTSRGLARLPHQLRGVVLMGRGVCSQGGMRTPALAWHGAFVDSAVDVQVLVPGRPDALDPTSASYTATSGTAARMLLEQAQRLEALPWN